MSRIQPYHLFICLLAIIGCETVHPDNIDFDPQLVIHSYFSPDSLWEVHVSQTKDRLKTATDLSIENANVLIQDFTSNFEFKLNHIGGGVYQTSHKPKSNHIYHIIVDDEELGIAQAIGRVPSLDHIEVKSSLIENENSQYLNIEVNSSEFNNSDSYFAWELVNLDETDFDESGEFTSDPEVNIVSVTTRDFTGDDLVYVDGESLNGNTFTDSIPSDIINDIINEADISDVKNNAAIKLVAISKELYNYYQVQESQAGQQTSNNNHSPDFFTNVKNGVGIFAGYREVYIEL